MRVCHTIVVRPRWIGVVSPVMVVPAGAARHVSVDGAILNEDTWKAE
jgi:hypothetical protein